MKRGTSSFKITWGNVTGADSYNVTVKYTNGSVAGEATVPNPPTGIEKLTSGTLYNVSVIAIRSSDSSSASADDIMEATSKACFLMI